MGGLAGLHEEAGYSLTPDPDPGPAGAGLLDPTAVRQLADELGLRPTKQRGQNFVVDANTIRRLVRLAGVGPGSSVLEVGPGLGSLTLGLLEAGARVIAVEIDEALARRLPDTVAERMPDRAGRLTVLTADVLRVSALPGRPTSLVANLPYNLAVPILLHLLAAVESLADGLIMVQAEVADRLVAPPGSKTYGVPSVKLAWHAAATRVGTVPPTVFWPMPTVDSGLVSIVRRPPPGTTATRERVFAVVDAAFAQRRKMLRSALAGLAGSSVAAVGALQRAGVDPAARGEMLDIAAFARVAEQLPV